MSRTKHTVNGKEFPAKTRKKFHDKKQFGFTSGTHSQFELVKAGIKKEFEDAIVDSPDYELKRKRWERIKDKTYPEKNKDFVKYGYGNGTKKENRTKNYQKEIE